MYAREPWQSLTSLQIMKKYIFILGLLAFFTVLLPSSALAIDSVECTSHCYDIGADVGKCITIFDTPTSCCYGTSQCGAYSQMCKSGEWQNWQDTGGWYGCPLINCWCVSCESGSSHSCGGTSASAKINSVTTNSSSYNSGDTAVVTWSSTGIDPNDFCLWLYKGSTEKEHHCTGELWGDITSPYSWTLNSGLETGSDYRFKVCQHGAYGCESESNTNITVYSRDFTIGAATQTCSQLSGTWCQSGQTCTGQDIASQTSDASSHSGQICCKSGTCQAAGTQTCSQLTGVCCTGGDTCNSGKILGASDCAECCGDSNNCSGSGPGPGPGGPVEIQNPIKAGSLEDLIDNIIDFIFKIAIVLAPLLVIVAGFLFITSAGDVKKVTQAKNILIYTAVGLFIVLLSKGILAIIKQILGTT